MGKFSSNAASALDKVLKVRTLVQIQRFIDGLESKIKGDDNRTADIEKWAALANAEVDPQHGQRLGIGYNMENRLTEHLDGPELARALSTAKSILNLMSAEREVWLLEQKKKHEADRHAPRWKPAMERLAGPGV